MMTEEIEDLEAYCRNVAAKAKAATAELGSLRTSQKNEWLLASAQAIQDQYQEILVANQRDVLAAPGYGLSPASIDRLRLDEQRVQSIATGLREVAQLPDPIHEVIESHVRPNGLKVEQVRVPLGVVFFIYESRPNVTADAAALCLKSGNAVILRGGKEAAHSSHAIMDILTQQARLFGIPEGALHLVRPLDREVVGNFLRLNDCIDVAIPRGGRGLIERVSHEATMPVIKHFDGNCHVYVERSADLRMAEAILVNSKTQRMGVCNACESLLVDRDVASTFLPHAGRVLTEYGVEIRGDKIVCELIPQAIAATEEDWSTEYLGPVISVKVVEDTAAAIQHINQYGSHHTDAIVTDSLEAAEQFLNRVDSAAVLVNASTRFNDGGQLGLGAEIGISTDKFHARGPCGLRALTSYKYVIRGNGQIRQ